MSTLKTNLPFAILLIAYWVGTSLAVNTAAHYAGRQMGNPFVFFLGVLVAASILALIALLRIGAGSVPRIHPLKRILCGVLGLAMALFFVCYDVLLGHVLNGYCRGLAERIETRCSERDLTALLAKYETIIGETGNLETNLSNTCLEPVFGTRTAHVWPSGRPEAGCILVCSRPWGEILLTRIGDANVPSVNNPPETRRTVFETPNNVATRIGTAVELRIVSGH